MEAHYRWDAMTGGYRQRRVIDSFAPELLTPMHRPNAPHSSPAPRLPNPPLPADHRQVSSPAHAVVVGEIAHAMFEALRDMDKCCSTGLCNFVSRSPFAGLRRKDEAAMTWGLTERLQEKWKVQQREHSYPSGGGECDRVIELHDGGRIWLELKLAWRVWFYKQVTYNQERTYRGYLDGSHHSHSFVGDFAKLERITAKDARYLAVLLIGFDGRDGRMTRDVNTLLESQRLQQRGWQFESDSWPSSQSDECWHRCWLVWRDA
jgi:hypothetical protein